MPYDAVALEALLNVDPADASASSPRLRAGRLFASRPPTVTVEPSPPPFFGYLESPFAPLIDAVLTTILAREFAQAGLRGSFPHQLVRALPAGLARNLGESRAALDEYLHAAEEAGYVQMRADDLGRDVVFIDDRSGRALRRPLVPDEGPQLIAPDAFEPLIEVLEASAFASVPERDLARALPVECGDLYARAGVGDIDGYLTTAETLGVIERQRHAENNPGLVRLLGRDAGAKRGLGFEVDDRVFDANVAFQPLLDTVALTGSRQAVGSSVRAPVLARWLPEPPEQVFALAGTASLADYLAAAAACQFVELHSPADDAPEVPYVRLEATVEDLDSQGRPFRSLVSYAERSDASFLPLEDQPPPRAAFAALEAALGAAPTSAEDFSYDPREVNRRLTPARWLAYQAAGRQTFEGYLRAAEGAGVVKLVWRGKQLARIRSRVPEVTEAL